jgi:adenylylsulfate kinase
METHARSIAKAVSYRLLGSAVTGLIFFVLTHKGGLSVGAGALDMIVKIGAYFVHERIWNHIDFGRGNFERNKPPEYEI